MKKASKSQKTKKALVTGSAGLIGSESVRFLIDKGFVVVGVDNNMRQYFFGKDASTDWNRKSLEKKFKEKYIHKNIDIRDQKKVEKLFKEHAFDIIVHTAAQPSHDWAAKEPITDFTINAVGTLIILENFRKYSPIRVSLFILSIIMMPTPILKNGFRLQIIDRK